MWIQEDFKPVLRELLDTHPGLEFLQSTPEFQERYGMFLISQLFLNMYQKLNAIFFSFDPFCLLYGQFIMLCSFIGIILSHLITL